MPIKSASNKALTCTTLRLLTSITASIFFMGATHAQVKKSIDFSFAETTIEDIHFALSSKTISCEAITQGFIDRITKYDQMSNLNAVIYINPNAVNKAKQIDKELKQGTELKPLQCIPVILKDNFDTADMPTEAGSIALQGSIPPDDAFMVKKLRKAGAIIIAKSNMGEWAFSPNNTISSTHGETRNAYDLGRVPAGSSGGTASAIAANFGVIGIGSDTGNSIRGPSSHLALVGMRSTIGTTSRDGIIPLLLNRDVGGPMLRTVKDTAKVFNVVAGFDPADPTTQAYLKHQVTDYSSNLSKDGLQGIRLGVLKEIVDDTTADQEVLKVYEQALKDLAAQGAVIVDPITIPNFTALTKATGFCSRFRYDLNNYLNTLTNNQEIKTLQDVVDQKKHRPENAGSLKWGLSVPANVTPAQQTPPCVDVEGDPRRKALLDAVVSTMDSLKLDAIVYPTWSNPPRKIGDSQSPSGNNSGKVAPHTGQPAITVPMGYVRNGLPVGLQILGRPFSEDKLFQYAYAYEQATLHRKAPLLFP